MSSPSQAPPNRAPAEPATAAKRGPARPPAVRGATVGPHTPLRVAKPPQPVVSTERPLLEAIFELRWTLAADAGGRSASDPAYDVLLGRLSDRMRKDFPRLLPLATACLPQASTPFRPRHQLRPAGNSDWPLIQLGPGVVTLNESGEYQWPTYEARIARASAEVFAAYPRALHAFSPASAALRYVNALPLDREEMPLVAFLRDRLHTSLSVDPALFDDPDAAEKPAGLQFSMTYGLPNIAGVGSISFASGQVAGKRSLLWTLEAAVGGEQMPRTQPQLLAWTRAAHTTLSRWFKALSRGQLASQFPGLAS